MARVAVEMLIIDNRHDPSPLTGRSHHRVLTHELVVRGSTGAPAQVKRKR
jgi:DNA-binding LacI/PurR family transcriptional regulator